MILSSTIDILTFKAWNVYHVFKTPAKQTTPDIPDPPFVKFDVFHGSKILPSIIIPKTNLPDSLVTVHLHGTASARGGEICA
ncbi:MAG: hypothetical protein WCG66_04785 [bacterium]